MPALFSLVALVAAILAVPQLLPQLARLGRTGKIAGMSWSWAARRASTTRPGPAMFALSGLGLRRARELGDGARRDAGGDVRPRGCICAPPAALALVWTALLIDAVSLVGRAGLGTALTVAFLLQVTPLAWTEYRAITRRHRDRHMAADLR